jgi:hypothetical protein
MKTSIAATLAILSSLTAAYCLHAESYSVTSPNGRVAVTVQLADLGGKADFPSGQALYYRVECGPEGNRTPVVLDSPLGLQLTGLDLVASLKTGSATPAKLIEESYTTLHGKRRECGNRAQEVTLSFPGPGQSTLELVMRAYDNGVAFRYRVKGDNQNLLTMEKEATGFALPAEVRMWMAPADKASTYSPGYETYYESEIAPGQPSANGKGWSFPVLFRTGDSRHWALLTEADVTGTYCATRLADDASKGVYRLRWPDPAEGNAFGAAAPKGGLPWETPWRLILVGDSLADIVESTLVEDVCPPSRLADTSWIKPGRVAWSWWSDNPSPTDAAKQMKFVDLAAEMGWEYVLVDANWTIMDNGTIHDVIRYAKKKGVGVLLWYNSGGPHNVVTEKPRDCFTYKEVRRFEFDMLKKWGVKGVKVDFFQSDKQNVMELYQGIMQDAADYQIMVNFHGCTLPRGWSRTYPHLMSMEAVRGSECYIFDDKYPAKAPGQNTITPFTRNVVGPMDFTPVAFSDNHNPHLTTYAHELALAVVFETGWLHFADKAEAYLGLPPAPKEFLKKIPVTWDDTRLVAGYPGKFVVMARRKGDTWYLGGINGENQPREERLRLGDWLGKGNFDWASTGDGATARVMESKQEALPASREITVKMLPLGGFAGTLKPRL